MDELTKRAKAKVPKRTQFRDKVQNFPGGGAGIADTKGKPRSRLRIFAVLGLLALAVFAGLRIATVNHAQKGQGSEHAAPPTVATAYIGTGDITVIINALGTVTPIATVTVKSRVDGELLNVGFKEGQTVKKGDFLAQIDPRPFEAAKAQFEGQLIHDQGLLDQAHTDLARYQTLVKQNSIARQQAEDQAFLVKQYEGSVQSDQAQIDVQKLNLIYAHIVSPIDGRIGIRMVDPGNYIQTTDSGLAVVTQMHPISVIFIVPEDNIPPIMEAMRAGQTLEVTAFDRANVAPLSVGKVVALDSQIDQATGTVKLRADFDNLDDKLFPNQFVNARLLIKTLRGVVTVPARAVQYGAPGAYVYVAGADDKVSVRPVELGPQDGPMFAVKSGLSPGDRVVVDGADRLRDGTKVLIASTEGSGTSVKAPPADNRQDRKSRAESGTEPRPADRPGRGSDRR
jgi:membrane fusion protein, multidrug efflux system